MGQPDLVPAEQVYFLRLPVQVSSKNSLLLEVTCPGSIRTSLSLVNLSTGLLLEPTCPGFSKPALLPKSTCPSSSRTGLPLEPTCPGFSKTALLPESTCPGLLLESTCPGSSKAGLLLLSQLVLVLAKPVYYQGQHVLVPVEPVY